MPESTVTVLHAAGVLDVDTGDVIESGYVRVEGNRITAVGPDAIARRRRRPGDRPARPHPHPRPHGHGGRPRARRSGRRPQRSGADGPGEDDVCAASPTASRTLLAGFTTVRNLGLFVKTGGYLLDVALVRSDRRRLGRGTVGSSRPATPSARPAVTSTRARRASSPRTSCRCRSRRASPTASTRSARPSATRSSTAPSSSSAAPPAA